MAGLIIGAGAKEQDGRSVLLISTPAATARYAIRCPDRVGVAVGLTRNLSPNGPGSLRWSASPAPGAGGRLAPNPRSSGFVVTGAIAEGSHRAFGPIGAYGWRQADQGDGSAEVCGLAQIRNAKVAFDWNLSRRPC